MFRLLVLLAVGVFILACATGNKTARNVSAQNYNNLLPFDDARLLPRNYIFRIADNMFNEAGMEAVESRQRRA
jgi:hypothetical protein